jgi:hypothetical protein
VKVEFPVAGAKEPDDPMRVGIGTAKFGLNVNFFNNQHKGVYISLYPQIEFTVPGTEAVEKGLANPGQTLILPLLVQKDFKHITVVANGAVRLTNPFMILNARQRALWISVLVASSLDTWRPWRRFASFQHLISNANACFF